MEWNQSLATEKAAYASAAAASIALGVEAIRPILDALTTQQRSILGVLSLVIGGSLFWVREMKKKDGAKTPKKGKK